MIDTLQKRMSAINPMSPWRGALVDATESGFNAGNRAAADYTYSGIPFGPPTPPVTVSEIPWRGMVANAGRMMTCRGSM